MIIETQEYSQHAQMVIIDHLSGYCVCIKMFECSHKEYDESDENNNWKSHEM